MKTLCTSGHLISAADKKALDHYLIETPKEWAKNALSGMINKAIKTIRNDYYQDYKDTCVDVASLDPAVYIPAILALPVFECYSVESYKPETPKRKEACDQEIWAGGFEVQDYEYDALNAFYENPEEHLYNLMENKVARRKEKFIEEIESDPENEEIPVCYDDEINMQTAKAGYLTRVEKEALEA